MAKLSAEVVPSTQGEPAGPGCGPRLPAGGRSVPGPAGDLYHGGLNKMPRRRSSATGRGTREADPVMHRRATLMALTRPRPSPFLADIYVPGNGGQPHPRYPVWLAMEG